LGELPGMHPRSYGTAKKSTNDHIYEGFAYISFKRGVSKIHNVFHSQETVSALCSKALFCYAFKRRQCTAWSFFMICVHRKYFLFSQAWKHLVWQLAIRISPQRRYNRNTYFAVLLSLLSQPGRCTANP